MTNRTDGVITHRYVLVYRSAGSPSEQAWPKRMPRRDYPRMWSRLCGPNGSIG